VIAPHDFSGLATVISRQAPEEALRSFPIAQRLEGYINDFAILIDCTPQAMLLAIDLF
jgi:hypothetical protein